MKRILSMIFVLCILFSFCPALDAVAENRIIATDINGIGMGENAVIENVDFTGIRSVRFKVLMTDMGVSDGEAYRLYIDNATTGNCIGYIVVGRESASPIVYGTNIETVTGTHNLYINGNYEASGIVQIQEVILSTEEWVYEEAPVSDSVVVDNYHDTWTAVDMMGRKIADYEETGPVKDGRHDVVMMYWPWHRQSSSGTVISDVIAKYPEAKDDYYHFAWEQGGLPAFWGESVYGFYTSQDYWVYRKQAQLLSNAGVDAIFPDCTNNNYIYAEQLNILLRAFHDAKRNGLNVPKIGFYLQMGGTPQDKFISFKKAYFTLCHTGEFEDLWYTINGKPVVVQGGAGSGFTDLVNSSDTEELAFVNQMLNAFEIRGVGSRDTGPSSNTDKKWMWLVEYPQWEWYNYEGRTEMVNLGVSINKSYIHTDREWSSFSEPYAKGRSFTEAFGDDYRPEAMYQGYFFKEQASRVLDIDPAITYVCGWNEWAVSRVATLYGETNAFVDLYDDDNSRDFEPSKGKLKDTYYMLLTDFTRKYKGTRPAPVATGTKTININGGASSWDSVGPIFYNDYSDFERDALGYADPETKNKFHYTTEVNNSISKAKVSFDDNNLYFYVECENDIVSGHSAFLNLYLNMDRNYATGWEGYDYVLNLRGKGILSKFTSNDFSFENMSAVDYNISGNVMQVAIPRNVVEEVEEVEFEFKWADSVNPKGDIIKFYSDGVTAPIGRFNYLYTEIEQTSLTNTERANLSGVTILKSGSQKMIVEGAKMNVYDKDIRVSAYEENGTIYIPITAVEELLGWGQSKVVYDDVRNVIHIERQRLNERTISTKWVYTTLRSYESRVEGILTPLNHPAAIKDGVVYIPASLLNTCFGYTVKSFGDGVYAIGENGINDSAVTAVLSHFN